MMSIMQHRYEGFLKTPSLWKANTVFNLQQFEITSKSDKIEIVLDEKLRLGKYVERLVSFELEQQKNISVLHGLLYLVDWCVPVGLVNRLFPEAHELKRVGFK